ncbi:MAG: PKD domain-containing protein [Methanobacteriota archaeon]|nr:MAG: PKD domain-containing protein [Euryarchaeota archaeon]
MRHAYSTPGTYIVTVTVTDDDGGAISASFTLVIP